MGIPCGLFLCAGHGLMLAGLVISANITTVIIKPVRVEFQILDAADVS